VKTAGNQWAVINLGEVARRKIPQHFCQEWNPDGKIIDFIIIIIIVVMVVYKILVGKPERKRPLGRPKRRWEEHTEIDLKDLIRL
jgi:hypothetical protein